MDTPLSRSQPTVLDVVDTFLAIASHFRDDASTGPVIPTAPICA